MTQHTDNTAAGRGAVVVASEDLNAAIYAVQQAGIDFKVDGLYESARQQDAGREAAIAEVNKWAITTNWDAVTVAEIIERYESAHQQDARLEREAVAKEVYEAMRWAIMRAPYRDESPPKWTEGGNSLVQDRARQAADSVLALRTQQPAAQPTDHAGEKGTATIAAQQPETDPAASPAPVDGGKKRLFDNLNDWPGEDGVYHKPVQPHKAEVERLNEKQRNMIGAHLDGVYLFSAREDCDALLSEIFKAALPPADAGLADEMAEALAIIVKLDDEEEVHEPSGYDYAPSSRSTDAFETAIKRATAVLARHKAAKAGAA